MKAGTAFTVARDFIARRPHFLITAYVGFPDKILIQIHFFSCEVHLHLNRSFYISNWRRFIASHK